MITLLWKDIILCTGVWAGFVWFLNVILNKHLGRRWKWQVPGGRGTSWWVVVQMLWRNERAAVQTNTETSALKRVKMISLRLAVEQGRGGKFGLDFSTVWASAFGTKVLIIDNPTVFWSLRTTIILDSFARGKPWIYSGFIWCFDWAIWKIDYNISTFVNALVYFVWLALLKRWSYLYVSNEPFMKVLW